MECMWAHGLVRAVGDLVGAALHGCRGCTKACIKVDLQLKDEASITLLGTLPWATTTSNNRHVLHVMKVLNVMPLCELITPIEPVHAVRDSGPGIRPNGDGPVLPGLLAQMASQDSIIASIKLQTSCRAFLY